VRAGIKEDDDAWRTAELPVCIILMCAQFCHDIILISVPGKTNGNTMNAQFIVPCAIFIKYCTYVSTRKI